jgi:hypothetical protein
MDWVRVEHWVIEVIANGPKGLFWSPQLTVEVQAGAICQLRDEYEDQAMRVRWNGYSTVPRFSAPGALQMRPPDDRVCIRESGYSRPQYSPPLPDGDADVE